MIKFDGRALVVHKHPSRVVTTSKYRTVSSNVPKYTHNFLSGYFSIKINFTSQSQVNYLAMVELKCAFNFKK